MDNYNVIYANLPVSINGFTMHDAEDDFFTVVLNAKMSYMTNIETFKHELQHITNDDFVRFKNVGHIERNAHY
jgi:hypothetical protein